MIFGFYVFFLDLSRSVFVCYFHAINRASNTKNQKKKKKCDTREIVFNIYVPSFV
jgi:hypothetical protein